MTFKVTTVKTRPALNIFWIADDDTGSTLQGAADTTGKLLSSTNTLSDDGLSITTVQIWTSKQVYIDPEIDLAFLKIDPKDIPKTAIEAKLQCKNDLNSVGVKYWVITSIDEALEMINNKL